MSVMGGKVLTASHRHGRACATQRRYPAHLDEEIRFSAVGVRYLLPVFVLVTIVSAGLGLFPDQAHAAGAFAAPAVKNIGQMPLDDEARRLVYPNSLGYHAAYD